METIIPQGQLTGFIVPRFLNEIDGLSLPAKALYGVLCDHARDKDNCFPSIAYLANELKASIRSIRNWLKELVNHALIYIEYRRNHSSKFWILKHKAMLLVSRKNAKSEPEKKFVPVRQTVPGLRQTLPIEETEPKVKDNINPPTPKKDCPIPPSSNTKQGNGVGGFNSHEKSFEAFWSEYPRKDAYWPAKKMWLRMLRQGVLPSMEKLRECLKRFMATDKWQRENGRYVPFLVNFLNGRLWLDLANASASSPEEKAKKQQNDSMVLAYKARLEKEKAAQAAKLTEENNEFFEPFLKRFADGEKNRDLAYMRWTILKSIFHRILTANDVENDNKLGVLDFINKYRNFDKKIASR